MKKISILVLTALLNVAMFSCTKQDLSDENIAPIQYSDCCDEDGEILPPPPPPLPPDEQED